MAQPNVTILGRFHDTIAWDGTLNVVLLEDFMTPAEDEAYQALKIMWSQVPIIQPQDWMKPFHVFVDAYDTTINRALMQLTTPNWNWTEYYASQRLSTVEKNYSTIEREAFGMIYSIAKFQDYLLSRKFTFHVDHSELLYLVTKQLLTS